MKNEKKQDEDDHEEEVDVTREDEIRLWSKKLNITPTELTEAALESDSRKLSDIKRFLEEKKR